MEQELISKTVKENYGFEPKALEKIKNIYKIKGIDGSYCLKIIKYEKSHFLFILGAMEHLKNSGFENMVDIYPTLKGEKYIKLPQAFAYLTPFIDVIDYDYDNLLFLTIAAKTLAKLHLKSRGFIVKPYMKPRVYYGKWYENFTTRLKEIENFKSKIEDKGKKSDFDIAYYNNIKEQLKAGEKAIDMLKKSSYDEHIKKGEALGEFCHHDYAHHNILMEKDFPRIIDFDYCILDTHLHDLASLIIRKMKGSGYSEHDCTLILDAYNEVYKIDKEDLRIMSSLLFFPQEFWQIGIQYYWEKQPYSEELYNKRLNKTLSDFSIRCEFLDWLYYHNYNG